MIRLVTVIGHGIELLPHFIEHYEKYVDEINIVVYESELYYRLNDKVKNIIKNKPHVKIVDSVINDPFKWSYVTYLYNEIRKEYPNDWWVIADIDEFHLYPNDDLKSIIQKCDENGWKIVRGGFIDRIGENGDFPEIKKDISLFKQFPYMGFFRQPLSDACPNKICVAKGDIKVTNGQHYAEINGQTTWMWQGWCHPLIAPYNEYMVQVHHFKWDKTSLNRLKMVYDGNGEYSDEYKKMYKALRRSGFFVNLYEKRFMFEKDEEIPSFSNYKQWNNLSKKIVLL